MNYADENQSCFTSLLSRRLLCLVCDDMAQRDDSGWGSAVGPVAAPPPRLMAPDPAADSAVEIKAGLCNADPITKQGKRIQMAQMLCVPLVPIIILVVQIFLTLADTVDNKVSYYLPY